MLILDFDGVVVESNAVKTKAFQGVFERFPEYTATMMAYHHAHVSLNRFAKIEHLLSLMGRSDDASLKADIAADFSRRVLEGVLDVPLVPGADRFLQMLTPRYPIYLASVTPAEELDHILEQRGLAHWFCDVYGCPPWTKADAIRDVLTREGVKPDEALLIGDSAGDQRAAKITGVGFLARDSGLSFDAPAPMMFTDLNEITQYLEEVLK